MKGFAVTNIMFLEIYLSKTRTFFPQNNLKSTNRMHKPVVFLNLKSPYFPLLVKLLGPFANLSLGDFKIGKTLYTITTDLNTLPVYISNDYAIPVAKNTISKNNATNTKTIPIDTNSNSSKQQNTTIILQKDQKDLDFQIILYQISNPGVSLIPMLEDQLPSFIKGLIEEVSMDQDDRLDEVSVLQNLGLSEHGNLCFNLG